jgi:hypothetical protein
VAAAGTTRFFEHLALTLQYDRTLLSVSPAKSRRCHKYLRRTDQLIAGSKTRFFKNLMFTEQLLGGSSEGSGETCLGVSEKAGNGREEVFRL